MIVDPNRRRIPTNYDFTNKSNFIFIIQIMMSKILPSSRSLIFFILPLLSQPNLASNIHFKERPQNQTLTIGWLHLLVQFYSYTVTVVSILPIFIGQNTTLRCSIYRQNGGSIPVQILWRSKGIILSRQQNSNQIPGYSGRYRWINDDNKK